MTTKTQHRHVPATDWLEEAVPQRQTAAGTITPNVLGREASQTLSTLMTAEVDNLRWRGTVLQIEIGDVHQRMYVKEWENGTRQRLDVGVPASLAELADLGFAWRDMARLVGVSVPAIQKWRKGGSTTPENRRRLALLLAACDLIDRHRSVADIGQWFEVPLVAGAPITPIDLWAAGQQVLVFEYALDHQSAEAILDQFEPDWRTRYDSDFDTFLAGDGQLSIRMRDR